MSDGGGVGGGCNNLLGGAGFGPLFVMLAGVDEIEVEGETVPIPRFNPGSWYAIDNPEFL